MASNFIIKANDCPATLSSGKGGSHFKSWSLELVFTIIDAENR
jgi:hypothetical protein